MRTNPVLKNYKNAHKEFKYFRTSPETDYNNEHIYYKFKDIEVMNNYNRKLTPSQFYILDRYANYKGNYKFIQASISRGNHLILCLEKIKVEDNKIKFVEWFFTKKGRKKHVKCFTHFDISFNEPMGEILSYDLP